MSSSDKYGPWAVIAGASDGTGAAFAVELARRGINLVLVARRQALLEELAGRLAGRDASGDARPQHAQRGR